MSETESGNKQQRRRTDATSTEPSPRFIAAGRRRNTFCEIYIEVRMTRNRANGKVARARIHANEGTPTVGGGERQTDRRRSLTVLGWMSVFPSMPISLPWRQARSKPSASVISRWTPSRQRRPYVRAAKMHRDRLRAAMEATRARWSNEGRAGGRAGADQGCVVSLVSEACFRFKLCLVWGTGATKFSVSVGSGSKLFSVIPGRRIVDDRSRIYKRDCIFLPLQGVLPHHNNLSRLFAKWPPGRPHATPVEKRSSVGRVVCLEVPGEVRRSQHQARHRFMRGGDLVGSRHA